MTKLAVVTEVEWKKWTVGKRMVAVEDTGGGTDRREGESGETSPKLRAAIFHILSPSPLTPTVISSILEK